MSCGSEGRWKSSRESKYVRRLPRTALNLMCVMICSYLSFLLFVRLKMSLFEKRDYDEKFHIRTHFITCWNYNGRHFFIVTLIWLPRSLAAFQQTRMLRPRFYLVMRQPRCLCGACIFMISIHEVNKSVRITIFNYINGFRH